MEELEKKKEENKRVYERNISLTSKQAPISTTTKIDFETEKSKLLENLDNLLNIVENPNEAYKSKITEMINKAKTFEDLTKISRKLNIDKSNQEEFIKQSDFLNKRKEELRQNLLTLKPNYSGYKLPYEVWNIKITKANTIDDVLKIEQMINKYKQATEILTEDALTQRQKTENDDIRKIAKAQAEKAVNTLIQVQKFLGMDNLDKKPIIYVDSQKEKDLSPKTRNLRPSKDFKYVDLRKYTFNPELNSIPNDVLLNGINLGNLIQRYGLSNEKSKFLASLAWKLSCYMKDKGTKLFFWLVDFGRDLTIAAAPATINFAAKHPVLTTSTIGGFVGFKWIKSKFFRTNNEEELLNNAEKINDEFIIPEGVPPPQPGPQPVPPKQETKKEPPKVIKVSPPKTVKKNRKVAQPSYGFSNQTPKNEISPPKTNQKVAQPSYGFSNQTPKNEISPPPEQKTPQPSKEHAYKGGSILTPDSSSSSSSNESWFKSILNHL